MDTQPLILAVDDDNDFRDVIVTKLRSVGFNVAEAKDGEEAFQKAEELKPALILMDVKMPKQDGIATLLKLKENPETRDIKVILLTAFGDPEPEIYKNDKRFAEEVGAVEYFLKTQDINDIVVRVKQILGQS